MSSEQAIKSAESHAAPRVGSSERLFGYLKFAMALMVAGFQLNTAWRGMLPAMEQRSIILGLCMAIIFLSYPTVPRGSGWKSVLDTVGGVLLAIASLVVCAYIFFEWGPMTDRTALPTSLDMVMGLTASFVVLETTRRTNGMALVVIVACAMIYAFFGRQMPGILFHTGVSVERMVGLLYMYTAGIFGMPMGVAAEFIVLFIIYSALLHALGGGQFFIDLAFSAFGRVRGGPAKISVVASGFFGTISGSAVANVVGTGSFTIPLMKRTGYKPHFAGAVEATASTGGQLMPPVMGAAAFLMAEMLGTSYWNVVLAALLPGILYYVALFIAVDIEAAKLGLKGLPPEELPSARKTLAKGWYLFLSPVVLVYLLSAEQTSTGKAGLYAILALVALNIGQQLLVERKLDLRPLIKGLARGGNDAAGIVVALAAAGMVVGVIEVTGLGMRLSGALIDMAGGNLMALLFLTMIASLILGMGLPTSGVYIIVAIMVAPALIKLGVAPMAAHMFVFYFGIIAAITPPVALAAYAAAGISGSGALQTAVTATRIGIVAFLLPFMFVYGPALLLIGPPDRVALAVVSAVVGVTALACAVQGYFYGHLNTLQRLLLLAAALLLIKTGLETDIPGYGLVAIIFGGQFLADRSRRRREAAKTGGLG